MATLNPTHRNKALFLIRPFLYLLVLTAYSCNAQDTLVMDADSGSKIPITARNFFQDNNYNNKPDILIDGSTAAPFVPSNYLVYDPHDVVVDLTDYNATVKKIRIYDGQGDGFETQLILVRSDNDEEVLVGTFTGNTYNTWKEFTPPQLFKASRFIMRGHANAGYGNELQLYGDFTPYTEPTYHRARKPLKNMLGVNAHWWNFLINIHTRETAISEPKYNAFLDLNLTSLRNYGNASEYQPEKGKWAFNPVRQGWYEDDLFKRLNHDRPELIKWSVMQGQFDFVKQTWNVPDTSKSFTGTVTNYIDHGNWGSLTISTTGNKGTGDYRAWHITLLSAPAPGKTAAAYTQTSGTAAKIPTRHPATQGFAIGGNALFKPGDKVLVTKGQHSELNLEYEYNNQRNQVSSWKTLGEMAYVWTARKGGNKNVRDYGVWSHNSGWQAPNEMIKGGHLADLFEGMNEPNAWWGGYDDFMNGSQLGPAWSMMYDGHKSRYPDCGVKNADPNFPMSTSGLATAATDLMQQVYWWSRKNRGINKDGAVDLPFDIIQFHNYSYTGGLSQYTGGVQAGLPPELSNVLDAVDEFVWYSNKFANGREVWCGEWGYDVNPESPMNAPAYGKYTAEQTRGNWAMRTVLEYSAHGLDRAQWYRLYQDDNNADNNATQFATMSLLRENEDQTISRRLVGDYFKQISELGDFVFESRISNTPRILKFKDGKKTMYAIWGVEKMTTEKGKRPAFTETTGTCNLVVGSKQQVVLKTFAAGADALQTQILKPVNGKLSVAYSAQPVFVLVW